MEKDEFVKVLILRSIEFNEKDGRIIITKNNGSLDLGSLTTLPENTVFENSGSLYLGSLTTLPENTVFENSGSLDLRSLSGKEIKYMGRFIKLLQVDGSTMIIESEYQKEDITIHKARYFGGGKIEKLRQCYIATKGNYSAHGDTEKDAIEDLEFKIKSENFDKRALVEEIISRGTVTSLDYRLITGACRLGVKEFKNRHNITEAELPLSKVLEIIKGEYGSEEFKSFFK